MTNSFLYVLPVHNEASILASNVARARAFLERFPGSEVYAVENGSKDDSWPIAEAIEQSAPAHGTPFRAFRELQAGIGYAYHRGMTEAVTRFGPSASTWAVLTASDLPFGFSDLEGAWGRIERAQSRILMGSKAHPLSHIKTSPKRRLMTEAYRVARRVALGMRVGDSQGSVFVRLDLAAELLPRIASRGFFYSTELCYFAERLGESIVELPVTPDPVLRASTVRAFRDGVSMLGELVRLRKEQNSRSS